MRSVPRLRYPTPSIASINRKCTFGEPWEIVDGPTVAEDASDGVLQWLRSVASSIRGVWSNRSAMSRVQRYARMSVQPLLASADHRNVTVRPSGTSMGTSAPGQAGQYPPVG